MKSNIKKKIMYDACDDLESLFLRKSLDIKPTFL